jgi:AraC-like DNA-binding protein
VPDIARDSVVVSLRRGRPDRAGRYCHGDHVARTNALCLFTKHAHAMAWTLLPSSPEPRRTIVTARPQLQSEFLKLSTADLPEKDRLAIWREVYGRFIFNVDIEPIGNEPFEAEVALRRLPGAGVSFGWRSPADYRFGPRQLAVASDNVVLGIVVKGRARVVQLGRDLTLDEGHAAIMTTSDRGYHALYEGGGHLAVQLPRSALLALLPDFESRLMRPFPPDSDALKLVIAYAKAALDLDPSASHELQRQVATHLRDLVVFLASQGEREAEALTARSVGSARLRAIKSEIERRLGQRGLSAEMLAATQKVSPDYVRKLFRQEGTSFSDYLLSRRLERAHAALSAPVRPGQRIASIASQTGFNDLSYFNRVFRRRYGKSPSDVRKDGA